MIYLERELQFYNETLTEFKNNPSMSHGDKIKTFRKCFLTAFYLGSEGKLSPSMIKLASSHPFTDLMYSEKKPTLFQINFGFQTTWFRLLNEISREKKIRDYILSDVIQVKDDGTDVSAQVFYHFYKVQKGT